MKARDVEMPYPLIGILPDGPLHFEGVHPDIEGRQDRTVGPTYGEQVCIALQVISERQSQPGKPVFGLSFRR